MKGEEEKGGLVGCYPIVERTKALIGWWPKNNLGIRNKKMKFGPGAGTRWLPMSRVLREGHL